MKIFIYEIIDLLVWEYVGVKVRAKFRVYHQGSYKIVQVLLKDYLKFSDVYKKGCLIFDFEI